MRAIACSWRQCKINCQDGKRSYWSSEEVEILEREDVKHAIVEGLNIPVKLEKKKVSEKKKIEKPAKIKKASSKKQEKKLEKNWKRKARSKK